MNQELKTIQLYGWLGKQFGRVHKLAVRDAAEAIRLLCVNFPEMEKAMIDSRLKNQGFSISIGHQKIKCKTDELPNRLREPVGSDVIKIIPAIMGSKNPLGQIFAGVAIVFASIFTFGAAAIAGGTAAAGASAFSAGMGVFAAGGLWGAVANIGIAVALGGVAQLLSPQKKGISTADSPNNGASYNFNGAVNTTAQGNPVPVLHGRMEIGGAVISSAIYSEDQA